MEEIYFSANKKKKLRSKVLSGSVEKNNSEMGIGFVFVKITVFH